MHEAEGKITAENTMFSVVVVGGVIRTQGDKGAGEEEIKHETNHVFALNR